MEPDSVANPASPRARTSIYFALSLVALASASLFAGAMLRPIIDRQRQPATLSPGELAVFIEHAALDVRLGRAGPLTGRLWSIAIQMADSVTKERLLGLCTEAALQARNLSVAASSEELRETLLDQTDARNAVRLRRIGLAAALGQSARAAELASPLIGGSDPRLADAARVHLSSSKEREELSSWVASQAVRDEEATRRAGLAALHLLRDFTQAERLLASLERAGHRDESLSQALTEIYLELDRPQDLVRVVESRLQGTKDESERARLTLLQASALARAGKTSSALSVLVSLAGSKAPQIKEAARRERYEILKKAGLLQAELRTLRDPAERAFVALAVERDYKEAVRLYRSAIAAYPDSLAVIQGLREAERRSDLAERRELYERVLEKDPADETTRNKLLSVLWALDENEAARQLLHRLLEGHENEPGKLIALALGLQRSGLDRDAAALLERAYAAESDTARRQQVLFSLADLYAGERRDQDARRIYTALAADGANPAVRERAVSRLASLLP
jgi:tetratricopeptide (TPR) repeat protein